MLVKGTRIEQTEMNIEVSVLSVFESLRDEVRLKAGVRKNWYLKDDGWFWEDDDDARHGSIMESRVLQASFEQIELERALKAMKTHIWRLYAR